MKLFKLFTILITTICFVLIITTTGCGQKFNFSNELTGTLTILGSSSMQEVCDALAEEFMKAHPKIEVIKSGAGSAQATHAVLNHRAQIGDLSRPLSIEEKPEKFDCHKIAIDGIAVCVNNKNKVTNLSEKQLNQIFTGKIKNWSEVNGPNKPIIVIGRDEASGTKSSFEEEINAKDKCIYSIEQDSNGKVKEKIKNDPDTIGYISFSSVDETIKPLNINHATPNFENITNSTYKLFHPFIQIVEKNSHDELINAWFKFVKSKQGQNLIKAAKLLPIYE